MTTAMRRVWAPAAMILAAGFTLSVGTVSAETGQATSRRTAQQAGADVSDTLALQVRLTRAGFSVGAIDGQDGPKTQKALAAFNAAQGPTTGATPTAANDEALTSYTITDADAAGPFEPTLPDDMMGLGALSSVPYTSITEMLAERFRASSPLLKRLNPGSSFAAGDSIKVPNVAPLSVPAKSHLRETADPAAATTATVRVSKAGHDLTVVDQSGAVTFYAPVSSGSEHDPLPLGEWKVTAVYLRPIYNYNPDLFWDANAAHAKTQVPGGPNNPVGLIWIDLDKEHYGLHGTPVPESIGITQSHGCVRLTNWDAVHLATLVKPGTQVIFEP